MLANLGSLGGSAVDVVSPKYLEDADELRKAATEEGNIEPVHWCPPDDTGADCAMRVWQGPGFVDALLSWVKYGYLLEDAHSTGEDNIEEELEKLRIETTRWLNSQCDVLNDQLRAKFWHYYTSNASNAEELRARALKDVAVTLETFSKSTMAKTVERSTFWEHPAKVPRARTLVPALIFMTLPSDIRLRQSWRSNPSGL